MNKEINIVTLSRNNVRHYSGSRPYVLISIVDPELPWAEWNKPNTLLSSMQMSFHDVDREVLDYPGLQMMTEEQAKAIASFVIAYIDKVDTIVVHCEAGLSRSAGVSMAIAYWLRQNTSQWPLANRHVYRLVAKQLMEQYDGRYNK